MVALGVIHARPELGSARIAAEGIREPRSAFEQYQALEAALAMRPRLDQDQIDEITAAAQALLQTDTINDPGRKRLAEQLLTG